jgi:hypothetical protein
MGFVTANIGSAVDLDLHEKPLHRIGSMVSKPCRIESIWIFFVQFFSRFPFRINSLSVQNYCWGYYMALRHLKLDLMVYVESDLHV